MSAPTSDPTRPPAVLAWVDARNGVAGDMLLGALVDAGAPLERLRTAVEAVLPDTVALRAHEVRRAGMRATKVEVDVIAPDQPHRTWATIRALLQAAPLDDRVRTDALAVFRTLAEAEARAHGIDVETVHFHEVGAWDSIADVVGVCAGLAELGVDRLTAGPVALGSGAIDSAHGRIPVPVPAVVELARGRPVIVDGDGELATPTGMALLAALATPASALPPAVLRGLGIGAGTRNPPDRPNVVRLLLADAVAPVGVPDAAGATVTVEATVLEANVDDLDPRVWPLVLDALLAAGASDAWLTPILMKKGRPAHLLGVLAPVDRAAAVRDVIFAHVPTLGVREHPVAKHELDRSWHPVQVGDAVVRVKVGHRGGVILSATPEFADVVAAADAAGRPARSLLADAVAAASASGLTVGAPVPPGP